METLDLLGLVIRRIQDAIRKQWAAYGYEFAIISLIDGSVRHFASTFVGSPPEDTIVVTGDGHIFFGLPGGRYRSVLPEEEFVMRGADTNLFITTLASLFILMFLFDYHDDVVDSIVETSFPSLENDDLVDPDDKNSPYVIDQTIDTALGYYFGTKIEALVQHKTYSPGRVMRIAMKDRKQELIEQDLRERWLDPTSESSRSLRLRLEIASQLVTELNRIDTTESKAIEIGTEPEPIAKSDTTSDSNNTTMLASDGMLEMMKRALGQLVRGGRAKPETSPERTLKTRTDPPMLSTTDAGYQSVIRKPVGLMYFRRKTEKAAYDETIEYMAEFIFNHDFAVKQAIKFFKNANNTSNIDVSNQFLINEINRAVVEHLEKAIQKVIKDPLFRDAFIVSHQTEADREFYMKKIKEAAWDAFWYSRYAYPGLVTVLLGGGISISLGVLDRLGRGAANVANAGNKVLNFMKGFIQARMIQLAESRRASAPEASEKPTMTRKEIEEMLAKNKMRLQRRKQG